MQQGTVTICLMLTGLFLPIRNEEADKVVAFCDQETTYIDVTQYPNGSINSMIAPTFPAGENFRNCYIKLEQIPDYSWCGVNITTLELSGSDVFNIQSGTSGDLVQITKSTLPGGFYIPTLNKTLSLGKSLNFIILHLLQYPIVGSALSSEIALSYTVAHVMDETNRPLTINTPPGSRGFIVSHKEFDFGTTQCKNGGFSTQPLILRIGNRSRIDIKFHYINLEALSPEKCKSLLKFDSVRGYTKDYYFELCAKTVTQGEWDYHLYPLSHSGPGDEIKLLFENNNHQHGSGYGFLLEYRVVQEHQSENSCDLDYIKNVEYVRGEGNSYTMQCRPGTTTGKEEFRNRPISCDAGSWNLPFPCTKRVLGCDAMNLSTLNFDNLNLPLQPIKTMQCSESVCSSLAQGDKSVQTVISTIPPVTRPTTTTSTTATTPILPVVRTTPPPSFTSSSTFNPKPSSSQETQTSAGKEENGGKDQLTWIIIGLVCGIAVVIGVIILVIVCVRKQRNSPKEKKRSEMTNNNEEGSVTVPLTLYNGDGGNIYDLADEGAILPDVVTHRTPMSPSPQPAAASFTPVEPDDNGELDYGNASTITGQHQMADMTDLYSPVLASQKKPKQPQVDLVDNDLYGSS